MPVRKVSAKEMLGGSSVILSGHMYRGRSKKRSEDKETTVSEDPKSSKGKDDRKSTIPYKIYVVESDVVVTTTDGDVIMRNNGGGWFKSGTRPATVFKNGAALTKAQFSKLSSRITDGFEEALKKFGGKGKL